MSDTPRRSRREPDSRPRALVDGLVVRELAGETLVYDPRRHRMHCLGPALAAVWRACDGRRTLSEIGARATGLDGTPLQPRTVRAALARLRRARLVDVAPALPARGRRAVLRAAGVAGLSIATLTAPRVADAASCIPPGECAAKVPGGGGGCGGLPCCGLPGQTCKASAATGKPCGCGP